MMIEKEPAEVEQLGLLIKETQSLLNQRMDEVLRPLGLSVAQYACLHTLRSAPGVTGSELARRVFVSRQSMSVLLQGLETRGLVERSQEPGPRRERAAELTEEAAELTEAADGRVRGVVSTMAGDLVGDEPERLLELLGSCRDALQGD